MNTLPADLIPAREAATKLRCHIAAIHRWILTGKLPGWKRGGRWFVSQADLVAMYRRFNPNGTPAEPGVPAWVTAELRKQGVL